MNRERTGQNRDSVYLHRNNSHLNVPHCSGSEGDGGGRRGCPGVRRKGPHHLRRFMRDDNCSGMRNHLKDAKGVLIYPRVLKLVTSSEVRGRHRRLMVAGEQGGWSYPAFYTMGSVSFGLQIGG